MTRRKPAARAAQAPPRTIGLTTAWAAAILGLLVLVFFHEVTLGGKTFVSPDAVSPAGFVRVGEQSLFQDRVYPLWNPFVFLGMPSFASGAYNPYIYPPDWPLALIQRVVPLPDVTWLLLYYFLGGLFMFLLAREWGARPEGALLAGVLFVFAPNLVAVGTHGHGSQLVDSAYLPLMLWLASRWVATGSLGFLGGLALAGGFQLLRGHVQICFYTWIAIALYAAIVWIAALARREALVARSVRVVSLAAAAALAFGLSAFYSLPLRDYAQHSIRGGGGDGGVGMEYATSWSLSPIELPSIVVPGWAGFGGASYWGGMPFTDYPNAFLGIVAVVLLVPAFLANGARRVFALVLAVTALLVAFGRHAPIYGFLYDHLPLFNKFRVPVMVLVLYQLAAALGVAWGWTALLEAPRAERAARVRRTLLAVGIALAVALVAVLAGRDAWRSGYVAMALASRGGTGYTAELAQLAYAGFVSDLVRAALIGLLAVGAGWLALRGRTPAGLATVVVLGLMLAELWPVSGKVMSPVVGDPVQRDLEVGRDDVVEFLEQAGPRGSFRILPLEPQEFQSNRYAGFAIASLGGYHAAKPRLFQDLIDSDAATNLGWMRLLGVAYIVTPQPLEPTPPYLREVFNGSRRVYHNLLALPRATVVGSYRVVTPAKAIIDSVRNGASESADVTYLEQDPRLTLGPVGGAEARIVAYRLNDVTLEVRTPGPALLRLADLWHPDWTATVDGRRVPVLKADYALRAVPVPAGTHRVVFRFESSAIRTGLMVSIASLVAILALMLGPRLRRRAGRAEPAPAAEAAGR